MFSEVQATAKEFINLFSGKAESLFQTARSVPDRLRKRGVRAFTADLYQATEASVKDFIGVAKQTVTDLPGRAVDAVDTAKSLAKDVTEKKIAQAKELLKIAGVRIADTKTIAAAKARTTYAATAEVASTKQFKTTAASAAAGAAVLGAGGATAGVATGGAMGAAAALPLAPFTLGLSIPVGAVMGAGTGLAVGAAAGAATGGIGGGVIGFGVFNREEFRGVVSQAVSVACRKADDAKAVAGDACGNVRKRFETAKSSAAQSVDALKEKAWASRERFVGGGTGGLETAAA